MEDVRARGGGKSNVDGARGEKILVEERAREREGEECMARRQREDEKSARGKRRRLYFAAARRGWTEGGIDLREVCAGKNIFTKFRNDTAQLMKSVRARGRKKQC